MLIVNKVKFYNAQLQPCLILYNVQNNKNIVKRIIIIITMCSNFILYGPV